MGKGPLVDANKYYRISRTKADGKLVPLQGAHLAQWKVANPTKRVLQTPAEVAAVGVQLAEEAKMKRNSRIRRRRRLDWQSRRKPFVMAPFRVVDMITNSTEEEKAEDRRQQEAGNPIKMRFEGQGNQGYALGYTPLDKSMIVTHLFNAAVAIANPPVATEEGEFVGRGLGGRWYRTRKFPLRTVEELSRLLLLLVQVLRAIGDDHLTRAEFFSMLAKVTVPPELRSQFVMLHMSLCSCGCQRAAGVGWMEDEAHLSTTLDVLLKEILPPRAAAAQPLRTELSVMSAAKLGGLSYHKDCLDNGEWMPMEQPVLNPAKQYLVSCWPRADAPVPFEIRA